MDGVIHDVWFKSIYMVPTAKEMLFSRTKLTSSRTNYIRFKGGSNQDKYEKAYHIYSMYEQLLTFLWYSLLLTHSSSLVHPSLFKFELIWDIKTMYRYSFSSTGILFIHGIFLF